MSSRPLKARFLALVTILLIVGTGHAQRPTNRIALSQLSETFRQESKARRTSLYYDLLTSTNPAARALNRDPDVELMYIDDHGVPVYYGTHNINAARTISTDKVWPGGGSGYNLTGGDTRAGQLALWDVGGVFDGHQEFDGRVIQVDSPRDTSRHATAVAGTMIGAGVNPAAKGMSYEAVLSAFDWNNDFAEMAAAAANGLLVSNHSYGQIAGWKYSWENEEWYWYGWLTINATEDYDFGFYGQFDRALDLISWHAPYYLIVESAGNDRTDKGPQEGEGHYHWSGFEWVWSTDLHNPDGGQDGFDTLPGKANAKNILTVGAVADIPLGYRDPGDVVQTSFSSWGPTDDGRIKPDIVANGDLLITTYGTTIASYDTVSGTSFSAPNVSGSANLLVGQYEALYNVYPRSATLKALIIFGADEAGDHEGPDYANGWGLVNIDRAADAIAGGAGIVEATLEDQVVQLFEFTLDTSADLRATVVWTDPPGPVLEPALNQKRRVIVNDIDVRITHIPTGTLYQPWTLRGWDPAAPAERGDNNLDNVEQIDIAGAPSGKYRVVVSHKGSLAYGRQDFSLVISQPVSKYVVSSYRSHWDGRAVEVMWTIASPGDYNYSVLRMTAGTDLFQELPVEVREDGNEVSFRDESTKLATEYTYRVYIRQGPATIGEFTTVVVTPPHGLWLSQNYPNPFNPETRIDYSLDQRASVSLRVYDVAGRIVLTLLDTELDAGRYSERWDGLETAGGRAASGVYFYRLTVGSQTMVRKMILLR